MEKIIEKSPKVIDNSQWKERHQFVLSANGNIVCQRYFKVNGFNYEHLESVYFYHTFRDAVRLIKNDLASKSRIYMGITMTDKIKLTGFCEQEDISAKVTNDKIEGEVTLNSGKVINKTYLTHQDKFDDNVEEPFEFKFSYLLDGVVKYEEIWDGSVYPKYIRNGVDLSNSSSSYKNTDTMFLGFSQQMAKSLSDGKDDLIYKIIMMFCDALSSDIDEDGNPITGDVDTTLVYGDRSYECRAYPREFVRAWGKSLKEKTLNYFRNR